MLDGSPSKDVRKCDGLRGKEDGRSRRTWDEQLRRDMTYDTNSWGHGFRVVD